jgi:hypothetical protein
MLVDNNPGCFMKITCSGIIAKTLPEFEYFLLRGFGQLKNSGKSIEEPMVIGFTLSHPGLLEDYFRHPNRIGVAGFSPGKIASSTLKP